MKVNFPTSNAKSKARIRARDPNKLDGLENLEVEVVGNDAEATHRNWKTIGIDRNQTGYGLQHLKSANYAL